MRLDRMILPESGAEFSLLKLFWRGTDVESILRGRPVFPRQAELALTNACSLKCAWCVDREFRHDHPGLWNIELLIERMQELKTLGCESVVVEGGGEPTMHPGFQRIMISLHDMGYHLGLTTNGVHLERVMPVVGLFDWIRVSLDAYDEESFRKYKRSDVMEHIMRNMAHIIAARGSCTVIGVAYLLVKGLVGTEALFAITDRLRDLGADYLQFRRVIGYPELDAGPQDLAWLQNRFQTEHFRVYTHQAQDLTRGNVALPCRSYQTVAHIAANQTLYACCGLRNKANGYYGALGNLGTQTFAEIWGSEQAASVREDLADGQFCAEHCPQCRHTKFNVMFDELERARATSYFI